MFKLPVHKFDRSRNTLENFVTNLADQDHRAPGRNTLWNGMPAHHRAHSHLFKIYNHQYTYMHAFGKWVETREPGGNLDTKPVKDCTDNNLSLTLKL